MHEVYNCETGNVVRRCRDAKEANRVAQGYEETFKWIDGSKFDIRLMDEEDAKEYKRREISRRIRNRGGRLKPNYGV